MTKRLTVKSILKAVGNPAHVEMDIMSEGYVLITYDDCDGLYETRSVMVNRLNHLDLEGWCFEINELLKIVKEK